MFFLLLIHLLGILHGRLWDAMDQTLALGTGVTSPVHVLTVVIGHHAPDRRVV